MQVFIAHLSRVRQKAVPGVEIVSPGIGVDAHAADYKIIAVPAAGVKLFSADNSIIAFTSRCRHIIAIIRIYDVVAASPAKIVSSIPDGYGIAAHHNPITAVPRLNADIITGAAKAAVAIVVSREVWLIQLPECGCEVCPGSSVDGRGNEHFYIMQHHGNFPLRRHKNFCPGCGPEHPTLRVSRLIRLHVPSH